MGTAKEQESVSAYLDTVRRLEPEIAMVDRDAALASIAISLKRIADSLEAIQNQPCNDYGETALPALARAIRDGLRG